MTGKLRQALTCIAATAVSITLVLMLYACGSEISTPTQPAPGANSSVGNGTPQLDSASDATTSDGTDSQQDVAGAEETTDPELVALATTWVEAQGIPFRNMRVRLLSRDDAYARIEVRAELRRSASDAWDENQATLSLKKVNNAWILDDSTEAEFVSPRAAASATAGVTATAVARELEAARMYTSTTSHADFSDIVVRPRLASQGVNQGGEGVEEGWIVGGAEGIGVVLHLENGRWEPQYYRGPYLSAVTISSPAPSGSVSSPASPAGSPLIGWAAKDEYLGGVARYDGELWQHEPLPAPPPLSTPDPWRSFPRQWRLVDLEALPSGEIWGVGPECAAHYVPGRGWNWSTADIFLYGHVVSVSFANNEEGFAVGGGGKIVRYNGNSWEKVESPTGDTLRACLKRSGSETTEHQTGHSDVNHGFTTPG